MINVLLSSYNFSEGERGCRNKYCEETEECLFDAGTYEWRCPRTDKTSLRIWNSR